MSQGWVVLGQLLRGGVLPGVLWFHRVCLRQGAQADQRPQQEPQSPQPAYQVRMHLAEWSTEQLINISGHLLCCAVNFLDLSFILDKFLSENKQSIFFIYLFFTANKVSIPETRTFMAYPVDTH